jgi:hypothetical protein
MSGTGSSSVCDEHALLPPPSACAGDPQVCPGEVTIVTGVPNSGKSEWLDALAVNLAESEGWRFALCSMEKKPRDHARQLLEKHVRKPLLQADYSRGVPQMSEMVGMDGRDLRNAKLCWLPTCNQWQVPALAVLCFVDYCAWAPSPAALCQW